MKGHIPYCALIGLIMLCCLGISRHDSAAAASEATRRVALVALIANPGRYNGELVEVTAWGVIGFEGGALYLNPSDDEFYISESGVFLWLEDDADFPASARGYMTVEGRFQTGRRRGYAGALTEIRQLHVLKTRRAEEGPP